MCEEFDGLVSNDTWELMPHPLDAKVIYGKWIFKNKHHSDGTLAHYKARWVVRGYSQ